MVLKVVEMIMVTMRVVTVCYGGEIRGVLVMMTGVSDDDGGDGMLWR